MLFFESSKDAIELMEEWRLTCVMFVDESIVSLLSMLSL